MNKIIEVYKGHKIIQDEISKKYYSPICGIGKEFDTIKQMRQSISICIKYYTLRPHEEVCKMLDELLKN